jgi:hypothetical protein
VGTETATAPSLEGKMIDIECTEFRIFEKNTLRGFATLNVLSWGVLIRDITYHVKGTSRWIGLPARKFDKADGTTSWIPILDYLDEQAKKEFQAAAVLAIQKFQNGATQKQ